MLKLKTEFTMIYGEGTYLHYGLSNLEKMGGSATLNSIYLSVLKALRLKRKQYGNGVKLNKLFIQLDNTVSSNKCFTVIYGLAALLVSSMSFNCIDA